MTTHDSATVDFTTIKARQQIAWSAGDYSIIGATLVVVSENLCETVDLHAGQRVLDVATGSGITALAAARCFCEVSAIDYVPSLLERGRERAAAERLPVTFQQADAEQLPFAEASFDVVLSTFGAMFAPNQEQVARELLRVCRSGGKIGMANWTPTGFVGNLFRIVGKYAPPAPGLKPPALWGTEERVRELFADGIASLEVTTRHFCFRYRSVQHWLDVFTTYYGPIHKPFQALDAMGQATMAQNFTDLLERYNQATDGTLVVPSEYLEVVARRTRN